MNNYNDFCRNILNIRNIDMKEKIKKIVQEEREHLIKKITTYQDIVNI